MRSLKRSGSCRASKALPFLASSDGSVLLFVRVTPRSARSAFGGVYDGAGVVGASVGTSGAVMATGTAGAAVARLKVRVAAPPVDGAANAGLVEFISKALGVAKSSVTITSGLSSRDKTVRIEGKGLDAVESALSVVGIGSSNV